MDAPVIRFNYMSHDSDWQDFRTCIRLTREIFAQEAFKPFARHEIQPGDAVQSDDELDGFIREHAESAYHPCGTCRMGSDPMAVVDEEMNVHGISGLRVVDASVMPQIISANLNAPTQMIASRAADFILGRPQLPPFHARFHFSDETGEDRHQA